MNAGGYNSDKSEKCVILSGWINHKYSISDIDHSTQAYTDEGISANIYETMLIQLFDENTELIGWAYGAGSQISSI